MRTFLFIAFCSLFFTLGVAQTSTTSATYSAGVLNTEFSTTATKNTSNESLCAGTLNVPVPAGRYVISVDVVYQGEAVGGGWISEQFSYLECNTTGIKEADVSSGPAINTAGVFNYNRTGLSIANGLVAAGGLNFTLHAFRTFGTNPSCSNQFNQINNNSWTVTVHHIPPPSCFSPSNLTFSNVQSTSADIGWTSGGASNWQIEYGPAGFTPGTGTLTAANSNPFTLSGLSPQTAYEFRVRDSCGVGDVSLWSSMQNFQTACSVLMAPWNENFDSNQWDKGTGFNNVGTIDTCWTRNWNNGFTMKSGPPAFSSTLTGPSADHTTGNGKYIFSELLQFGALPFVAEIESPQIDLSALTVPELTFWYHMFGLNVDKLDVEISDNNGANWASIFSRTGQLQSAKTDPWKEVIVNLSAYANQTVKLRFKITQSNFGTNGDVAIDDVDIHEAPSCARPQDLAEVITWTNRATLGWTSGGASQWQLQYGTPGFSPGTGTFLNTSSNPATIYGLSPNTVYEVYVRDSCAAGDVSQWTGPIRIRTQCVAAAPFTHAFSGSAFTPGPAFNDTGTIGSCWRRDQLINYVWKGGPPPFSPFNTGPSVDHTSGTAAGQYVFTQAIGFAGSTNRETNFKSPVVDLTPLTNPQLTFWYHMFGADILKLSVRLTNGNSTWNLERVISGAQQTAKTDPWTEVIVDLSAYAGDSVMVEWRAEATSTGTASNIAIDDFNIDEAPSCPKPQNLIVSAKTNTSVTLDWLPGGTASFWNIEYGPPGFTQGNGTLVTAASQPFTVNGLSANTAYEFYVRDSCGAGDVSVWVGSADATTECNPLSAPWTEDFESSGYTVGTITTPGNMPSCWLRPVSGNYTWTAGQGGTQSFNTGPDIDHTLGTAAGKFLYSEAFFGINQTTSGLVETPLIDLTPLTIPEFSFWYHMFGLEIDSLLIEVSDGVSWNAEMTLAGQQQSSSTDIWEEAILDLSAYANDTVKIRFTAFKVNNFSQTVDIAIDDLDMHEQPLCPKPSNLVLNSVSSNSVTFGWTSGGATDWQIEYGPIGFSPGSGSIVNANTNPFTVTGLNSSTSYDFYVRDSCGLANVSAWRGLLTATTECLPVPAPWSENFDGSNFVTPIVFNDTGTVALCWERNVSTTFNTYLWIVGPETFNTFNTGPSGDHTTGSGKYVFTETQGFGALPEQADIETPFIDLSPLTVPELSFWYHMFGATIGDLEVEIDNGSGYVNLSTISGEQQTSETQAWEENIINLSAYADDTVRLRFRGVKTINGTLADIAIDDVFIREAPSCPKPSDIQLTSSTSTSLTIDWISGGATNWLVRYRVAGSAGAYTILPTGVKPFTITGLNSSTLYEVWVSDSCAPGDVSEWVGPEDLKTDCGVVIAPWVENFDGPVWVSGTGPDNDLDQIDDCWSRPPGRPNWSTRNIAGLTNNTGPQTDVSGNGNYIYRESSFGGNGTATITTPLVFIPPAMSSPQLYFSYHMFGANITSLTVTVNDAGGTLLASKTISGQQQTSSSAAWIRDSLDLTAFTGDTVQMILTGVNSGFLGDIAIDEMSIEDNAKCKDPTNLMLTNVGIDSVTVSWSSDRPSGSNLIFYELSAGPGAAVWLSGMQSPLTINDLNPNTTYVFGVFDSCATLPFMTDTIADTVSTLPCPVLTTDFNYTINLLNVAFDGSLSTNADSLFWLFGDGTLGSGIAPVHLYPAAGTYVVTLMTWTDCGLLDTLIRSIDVCDTLNAVFTQSRNILQMNFDGSASLNPDSTYWTFGDGNNSNLISPSHTYSAAGSYTVWLYTYNNCGVSDSSSAVVQVCDTLLADFNYVRQGDSIVFDGSTSSGYNSLKWDFGDGTSSNNPVSTHLYQNPGVYMVTLKVKNECGDSLIITKSIQLCLFPVPSWTYTILGTTSAGMEVQFDATTSQNAVRYDWNFGDGSGISGQVTPVHLYLIPSLGYFVSLTVENNCGDKRTYGYRLNQISLREFDINQKIDVYPNPSRGQLILSWNPEYTSPKEVSLFSIQGKELRKAILEKDVLLEGKFEWWLNELPDGVYIVNLKGKALNIRERIILKH